MKLTRSRWWLCPVFLLAVGCGSVTREAVGIDQYRLGMTEDEVRSSSSAWSSLNVFTVKPFLIFQMQNSGGARLSPFVPSAGNRTASLSAGTPGPGRLNISLLANAVVSMRGETSWVDFEALKTWLKQRENEFTEAYGIPKERPIPIDSMTPGNFSSAPEAKESIVTVWRFEPVVISLGVEVHYRPGQPLYGAIVSCANAKKLEDQARSERSETLSPEEALVAAKKGDAKAQFHLGVLYERGRGVPQDYKEAVKWYRLAADQGYADAQANLASMYQDGQGVPQDYKEAIKWHRRAAEQGNVVAQANLGRLYFIAESVRDDKEALKWLGMAAVRGNVGAQVNLGVLHVQGAHTPVDYKEAMKWFRIAASGGDPYAQKNLGYLYEYGKGVSKDVVQAFTWYSIALSSAESSGRRDLIAGAHEDRDRVGVQITPAQRQKAERQAREWKPQQ